MGEPRSGPCQPWIDADEVFECEPCSKILEVDQDAELAATVADVASELLFMLSRRQFSGECQDTVRPCRQSSCWSAPPSWAWDRSWGTCVCGAESWRACGCGTIDEISLGGYPVTEIVAVKIDGVTLGSSAYRIDDHRFLTRIDGDLWPSCQDLGAGNDDDGAFAVTFKYGIPPPSAGVLAAKKLACELYQACKGGTCNLPKRVQTISRQDVTVALLDPFAFFEQGRVGIYEVDLFLSAYTTGRQKRGGSIVSPDVGPAVRRVGT